MRHLHMADAESFAQAQRFEIVEADNRRISVLSCKDVAEALPQAPHGFGRGETGDRPGAPIAQRSQIVDAVAVVRMVMRPEDGVYAIDVVGEELRSEIGWRVDQNATAGVILKEDGDAGTTVFRFAGIAQTPVYPEFTAQARHTGRGATAKDRDLHAAAFLNNEKKLRVVASANCSNSIPRSPATKRAVSIV